MNSISQVKRLIFVLAIALAITTNAAAQPGLEHTDAPAWYPEQVFEDFGYGQFRQSHFAWADGDLMKSIGIAQCSTDSASIEAARYHAIAGLVYGIIWDVPEDSDTYYWPEMVYELSAQAHVTVEGQAKKANGQVMCLVSIKQSDAQRLKAALTAKMMALIESEHRW